MTTPSKERLQDPPEELLKETVHSVSVSERFRDILLELIMDVVNGGLSLPLAKHKLHFFVESLSEEEKEELAKGITTSSKRIRDIADTLTSETPSLMAKIQARL